MRRSKTEVQVGHMMMDGHMGGVDGGRWMLTDETARSGLFEVSKVSMIIGDCCG